MPSWEGFRSRAVILESIQIEMSGGLPSSRRGTQTQYRSGRVEWFWKLLVTRVMLYSPARRTRIHRAQNRLAQLKSILIGVGILPEAGEIPTRPGSVVPRERAGEGRESPCLTRARRDTPRSGYYPEVPVLESGFPFALCSLGSRWSPRVWYHTRIG